MKTGYQVGDAMTKKPITVPPSITVEECARIMAEKHIGSMIIIEKGRAKGIVTEQDIVRKVIAPGKSPAKTPLGDIMVTELVTVAPDSDVYDALVLMREHNIRHLPVVHKDEMVGFLTMKDVLKIEPQLFELLVDKFELREEGHKPITQFSPSIGACDACGTFSKKLRREGNGMVCEDCQSGDMGDF
ncbi:CBS domain-containing protein [Candidatus Woesearchaeota archaeon]|nr:CBS domain-containing protein [Candidatus Woesearchaeota archaeon]